MRSGSSSLTTTSILDIPTVKYYHDKFENGQTPPTFSGNYAITEGYTPLDISQWSSTEINSGPWFHTGSSAIVIDLDKFEGILVEPREYVSRMIKEDWYGYICRKTTTSEKVSNEIFDNWMNLMYNTPTN